MVTSSRARVCLLCAAAVVSSLSYAVTPVDRIVGPIAGGPKVALKGNVHGFAKPDNDLGLADSSRVMQGVTLVFRPSPAQQKDLEKSLAELGDPSSPNYHKYLTPKQFGQRYGMSSNDLNKITTWLASQGFTNIKVANGRNEISFDGTVRLVESAFAVEMHHYLVDGVVHLANAGEPMIPQSLTGAVVNVSGLNDFAPKPRVKATSHLTSYKSGSHFLTPGDFAAIYGIDSLLTNFDGTGQKIAVVGQSSVSTTDLNNFRTAANLPASSVTMTLVPSNSTSAQCTGDEGESELDLEWAGGVAKGATIIFVYAGLTGSDSCTSKRSNNVWNALDYAVQHNVAPFVSTSYGFCESGLGSAFAGPGGTLELLAQQALTQGQTIVAAAGDAGAADCEDIKSTSASTGLAVDAPGTLPEVTSAGGNEFVGDAAGSVSGTAPNTIAASTQYWDASGTGNDGTVITATGYIPEQGWNDTTASIQGGAGLSATGGGASIYFSKPTWQAGTGVPNDFKRDVPDISLSASPDHDAYLVCSTDMDPNSCASPSTTGFRDGSTSNGCPCFTGVGGTSAAAPTFAAILAIINQSLGTTGLAPVNPRLYQLASNYPNSFHDVTSGDNKVPCKSGTTDCPAGTTTIGFAAGPGYDQVTGLGSANASTLAQNFAAPGFMLKPNAGSYQVTQGGSASVTVTVTPLNGFSGAITYTCTESVSESTCTGPTTAVNSSQPASFTITTAAPTAKLNRPLDRGSRIFYAIVLPGFFGVVFVAASGDRSRRGVRILCLLIALGCSTTWLASCGGSSSSSHKDPGTPTGTYGITVTGTSGALTSSTSFQLVVVQ